MLNFRMLTTGIANGEPPKQCEMLNVAFELLQILLPEDKPCYKNQSHESTFFLW